MWLCLITAIPTESATMRQRVWRALKTAGAGVLRDGVYLLPKQDGTHETFDSLAQEVQTSGGSAHLVCFDTPRGSDFRPLFDRNELFAALLQDITQTRQALTSDSIQETLRQTRKLRKTFAALAAIDFFPGESQSQVQQALLDLELSCAQVLSPDEPRAHLGTVARHAKEDHQGRNWATRQRPWVDRLASAWLIRRFIDPHARFVWLKDTDDCPSDALGFDFDGATFSHQRDKVTFEVLCTAFDLSQKALQRLGLVVHFLDVGGVQPPEAAGTEAILMGMRERITDDDALLDAVSSVFDGLLASFSVNDTPRPS